MLGIPLALAYTNMGEWLIHKYVLHGLGKNPKSFWAFHWHDHHRESRQNEMFDPQYERTLLSWSPQSKEALSLLMLALAHVPLFPLAPFFTGTVLYRMYRYYVIHKRSHLDREWAKAHLSWHYDHHMGKDQNANWCVTHPWFDQLMGTRKVYRYSQGRAEEVPAPT
ncbi:MAG: sterol desaturase family protein [Myxococcota bacterium]